MTTETPPAISSLAQIRARMLASPSPALRVDAAAALGAQLSADLLSEKERHLALEIVERLAADVERQVREVLSAHLKSCALLPPSTARALAEDVESVSLPFIEYSPALSDGDLVDIIGKGGPAKQIAVAKRPSVASSVAEALVDTGSKAAVATLLGNRGAAIPERSLHKVIDRFEDDRAIQELLVERAELPLGVTERLIRSVADELRKRLIEQHGLPWDFAGELAGQAGEGVLVRRMVSDPRVSEVERLAAGLQSKGKLTPTLLLHALCMGDSHFLTAGLATLAHIPIESAVTLMSDSGEVGFRALYGRAGLPPDLFRAFRAARDAVRAARLDQPEEARAEGAGEESLRSLMREFEQACPATLRHLAQPLSDTVLGRSAVSTG